MADVLDDLQEFLDDVAQGCTHEVLTDECDSCRADTLGGDLANFRKAAEDTLIITEGFPVIFGSEQEVNRVAYLVHRDLARTLGNIQLAQEKFDNAEATGKSLPGNQRRKAKAVIESAPEQAAYLRSAQKAVQAAMVEARKRGQIG